VRKAIRYRLFGMGKMPELLRNAAAAGDVVLAAEGLPVRNRVTSLRISGATVHRRADGRWLGRHPARQAAGEHREIRDPGYRLAPG
jgi:hypothetical protein